MKPVTFNSQSNTTVAKKQEVLTCYISKRQGHRAGECRSNNVMKQNPGRGCFYCGEITHVRRDCPRLKREGSNVSAPKRAGSAAVRVVETRNAAPEGSAGVTDTGCEGIVVNRRLVEDSQLTGKCYLIVRIDNTVLLAEKAEIHVEKPYLSGDVDALCIPEAICDLVVGNVPDSRNADDPHMSAMVGAVTTRAQARQEAVRKPLRVPDVVKHTGVD